ncbi:SAM-dependent methyltransferase [Sphingomonas sp. BN140010]|uniref:SAM-dependent methyltransferase n=1 Tax=Sphingomonas arvum TaxID=2992113 RepID=A0ABT3JCM3_9SPHN|nr:SAM-dependent methyltransferase [Sphingomonas sp. BN140010]MCW3796824.1 SAM-dependent methyltransferase [Sphingomonas sp. BN140010]
MADPLFDKQALALRRSRAARQGPRLFLAERMVADVAERLQMVKRRFGRGLLVGCPDERLAEPLGGAADQLVLAPVLEDLARFPPTSFELLIVLGQLDTTDELPAMLQAVRHLLAPGALFMGAFPGNDTLPVLRSAMLEADQASGHGVAPRVHPRIGASAFAGLLHSGGFELPVVDVDRVRLRYRAFSDLVADLRGMAATNVLAGRSRQAVGRAGLGAAQRAFAGAGDEAGTIETAELIHFAAWTPANSETA